MTILRGTTIALLTFALLATGTERAGAATDDSSAGRTPGELGSGASALQRNTLFIDLPVDGADNKPTWFAAAASSQRAVLASDELLTGDPYRTNGAHYSRSIDSPAASYAKAGAPTFDADTTDAAKLTDTVDGGALAKKSTHQLGPYENPGGGCFGGRAGAEGSCVPVLDNGRIAAVRMIQKDVEPPTLVGRVLDGRIEGAVVCNDLNRNGRCDAGEPQARSDTAGAFDLSIVKDSTAPLVAEVIAGVSRDADKPGTMVDVSYRMASPSSVYSTNITPFTMLVQLSGQANLALAEDLVRNELGLPPRFDLRPAIPPAAGSLTRAVENSIVTALKATAATVDPSAPGAFAAVVAAFPPALTTLPTLRITTKAGAPIVSKDVYVEATILLTNPAVSNDPVPLNGQIRGRGHTTWGQPKDPYKIQFKDDGSWAAIPDVLGMKKNRNWALLADFFDKSLIRNKLAYSLGNSTAFADGLKWTPSGQHVEVFLNEDYVGVYLLTEDIRIDPARLDIKAMSKDPAVGDVDGGYIVEVDWRLDCYNQGEINLQHVTPQGVPICIDKPDEGDITLNQLSYIKRLVDSVEADVYGRKALDTVNPTSYADWYLLQELLRNNDAVFYSSDFMWKDSATAASPADRLLNMGPIWDFDLSAGNTRDNGNWAVEGCWVSKPIYPNWITAMFNNPQFVQLTISRWQQKRPAIQQFINASIDAYARRLDAAQQRNFARWPILGVQLDYGDPYLWPTYAKQVAFVKSFLNRRMAWLDKAYASSASFDALCRADTSSPGSVDTVEFYNSSLDHYFITWMPNEIGILDVGTQIRGWTRTGYSFKTYTVPQAGTSPVCRYYIPPVLGDSHFFGRGTEECTATGQKFPSFVLEDPQFMHMFLPTAGVCPANTTPVYRVFSNRPDANHRYMTDRSIRDQMVAKGWLAEGDGPDLVVMCAPL